MLISDIGLLETRRKIFNQQVVNRLFASMFTIAGLVYPISLHSGKPVRGRRPAAAAQHRGCEISGPLRTLLTRSVFSFRLHLFAASKKDLTTLLLSGL